jgi:hypothetical protein
MSANVGLFVRTLRHLRYWSQEKTPPMWLNVAHPSFLPHSDFHVMYSIFSMYINVNILSRNDPPLL